MEAKLSAARKPYPEIALAQNQLSSMPWIALNKGLLPAQLVFLQCTSLSQGEQIDKVLEALEDPVINSAFAVAPWHGFLWRSKGDGVNHDPHQPRQRRQT